MSDITILPSNNADSLSIEFTGNINENCEMFSLDLATILRLDIDLSGLKYINSVGVKSWVQWAIRNTKETQVKLHGCTVLFVNQVNLVVGFLPDNFSIDSFEVPYFCEKCSLEKKLVLKREVDFFPASETTSKKIVLPSVMKCEKDDSEMDLDVIYLKYFSFLDYRA